MAKQPNKNTLGGPQMGFAMVSKMVTEGKKEIGFLYREKPLNPYDSGWRVFNGKEPKEYNQNQSNFEICETSKILKIDKSLRKVLSSAVGSAFSKKRRGKWIKAKGFKSPDDFLKEKKLGREWVFEINNLFQEQIDEDKSIVYTHKNRSVRVNLWKFDGKSTEEVYQRHKEYLTKAAEENGASLENHDYEENGLRWLAGLFKETENKRTYYALHAFCLAGNKALQTSFYYDATQDKQWAMETWESVRFVGE